MSLMGQHWLFAALAIIDAVLEKMHLKGHIDERCLRDLDPYKREYLKEDTVSPAAEHSIVPCGNCATARRSSGTPRPPQASNVLHHLPVKNDYALLSLWGVPLALAPAATHRRVFCLDFF